ncbi:MAG TPA: pantetheine-phosphate adenylyltransferase [Candidatus Binatia bacterium]|nr:pantetheine-phosphate adenylyltransferase [Candidatus Binatia bacterium]
MNSRFAVYPGSFDPMTNGHLDIVRRGLTVFDEVRVAVAYNQEKPSGLFTPAERVDIINQTCEEFSGRVSVDAFHGLLIDYCRAIGAGTIIRGLRAVADFEYEFQMTMMNRHLAPDIETVFLMADEAHFYTSSRLVKEVATLGGNVHGLVPDAVEIRLLGKLGRDQ